MRNASTVLSMIAVLVCITPLAVDAGMVYDTGELSINRWHVHLSRHAFEAESGQPGYLEIRKNTPGLPIRMGFLRLNRRWIPLKRFLVGPEPTLRKTITLRQRNRFRVLLFGSPEASISITITTDEESPPPVVDFSATPESIEVGSTSTLAWSCLHTDACTIEPDIGAVDAAGSIAVSPTETTTYTFTATGPGGTTTASATVAVVHPAPTIEISVTPDTIGPDEVSILSWHTSHSDACVIEPDIGSVEPVGLKAVAPLESTTYTITATGPGGTASAQARLTVDYPSPIVDFRATPDTITQGDSATLQWFGTYGTSAMIEPGIGQFKTADRLTVSPSGTTTYTVVVTGPGGITSAAVTVTVIPPPPQVTLTAAPIDIAYGGSATLTWSSQLADQMVIDQGIGNVASTGLMKVFPQSDTTYTITATGPGGTVTASATIAVRSPMRIVITSPANGDTIDRPDTMVEGTFTNETGTETGITVNGKVAMVYGNRFVVNHVSLAEGQNTITATATDIDGNTQMAEATVYAVLPDHYISLLSTIESGSAPQSITLGAAGTFSIQDAVFSHTGINPDEFVETAPDEYEATFTEKGITLITVEAIHAATTYRDTIAFVIVDKGQVDALLQQKWTDMKAHLAAKDVTQAVRQFDDGKKGLYEEVFSALLDRLPQIAGDMQDISLISIDGQSARYRIRRTETHNTGTHTVTYYVYFIKDETGIWKIYRF